MISNNKLTRLLNLIALALLFATVLVEYNIGIWQQLRESEHTRQYYAKRANNEIDLMQDLSATMRNVLAEYQTCDEQFIKQLFDARFARKSITNVFAVTNTGEICSEYRNIALNYKINFTNDEFTVTQIANGIAFITLSADKSTALVWEASYLEMLEDCFTCSHKNIILEYWLNDEFLIDLGLSDYSLKAKDKSGYEEVPLLSDETSKNLSSPLRLKLFKKESYESELSLGAYLRIGLVSTLIFMFWWSLKQKIVTNLGYQIRSGINELEFKTHFQPIVDMRDNTWVGAEALIRWYRHDKIYKYPDEFIPYAEEKKLSARFTDICINDSMQLLSKIPSDRAFFTSINIAPNDLNEPLIQLIVSKLSELEANHTAELELTERGIKENRLKATTIFVEKLHKAGFNISLDDFGTGQSGLSYIKSLHFDKLKVDKNFVQAINTDSVDALILNTIIELATNLGVELVAEGVETQEQMDWLLNNGVYLAQGWYFERDLPLETFITKMG